MFIFLSKLLPLFIYPVGLTICLLVFSLILTKHRKWHTITLISALIILSIGGNRWVAQSLARSLEWRYIQQDKLPQASTIVLLGGATHSASYPRPTVEINGAGDRLLYTINLYKHGKAEHILLSGGSIDNITIDAQPAEDMKILLTSLGIPNDTIWIENQSRNTYENAVFSQRILKEHNINEIILVTSAMHMPRSVALFKKLGIQVIPAPTDFTVTKNGWEYLTHPTPSVFLINLIPTADNLSLTSKALKEYIGMVTYSLRGWM